MGRHMGYIGMYKVAYDIFPPFRKWRPDIYKLEWYVIHKHIQVYFSLSFKS